MDNALQIQLYSFTLDCKNTDELAAFYAKLLGWDIVFTNEKYACVGAPGTKQGAYPGITLQANPAYQPPVWPEESEKQQQMAHLDIAVNDLDKAVSHAIQCGATEAPTQFSNDWKVMFDPAGHPFCLCPIKHIFAASE